MRIQLDVLALMVFTGCGTPDTAKEESDESTGNNTEPNVLDTTGVPTTSSGVQEPSVTATGGGESSGEGVTTGPATPKEPPTDGSESSGDGATTGSARPSVTTTGDGTTGGGTTGGETTGGETTGDPSTGGESTTGGPWKAEGCPEIYAQELLPTFEIEIAADVLADLEDEWTAMVQEPPDHPLALFRYEGVEITNASIRLRGNDEWWPDQGKMQFQISFNTYDKKAKFMGQKHLAFDAAKGNASFLRDRLALHILRDVGLPAPCANNARLMLNGAYYGLFTSIEKVDSEFLERVFENPDGNLYKRKDWALKTNEEEGDEDDIEDLLAASDIDELDAVMNLEEAVLEWAGEAVIPDGDGAWAGGYNYYVYNDPLTGFNVIPWDLDSTFSRLPADTDPVTYLKPNDHGRPFYDMAIDDPTWYAAYVDAIEHVLTVGYDVDVLQQRIDTWTEQIEAAAEEDDNKPFSNSEYHDAVEELYDYIPERAEFLESWLE